MYKELQLQMTGFSRKLKAESGEKTKKGIQT